MAEEAQEYDGTGKMPSFSHIKNKHKRQELYQSAKKTKRRVQLQTRMQRKKLELAHPELKAERLAKNIPRTVENSKTWVGLDEDGQVLDARTAPVQLIPQNPNTADDNEQVAPDSEKFKLNMAGLEDLFPEEQHMHFDPTTQPEASSSAHPTPSSPTKVLITTTPKPSKQLMTFLDELQSLLGGQRHAEIVPRKNSRFQISKVSSWAAKRGYGALLVVGEDHKQPSQYSNTQSNMGMC